MARRGIAVGTCPPCNPIDAHNVLNVRYSAIHKDAIFVEARRDFQRAAIKAIVTTISVRSNGSLELNV